MEPVASDAELLRRSSADPSLFTGAVGVSFIGAPLSWAKRSKSSAYDLGAYRSKPPCLYLARSPPGMSEAPTKAQPIAQRLRSDAAANRERILAAATIAVRRDGEKVPMATIADDAGVGIGTLYRHYPTRPALLAALTLRSFKLVLQHARAAALSDEPPPRPSRGSSNRRSRPATSSSSRSTAAP